jgi:thiosulfate/3-mercaptopyruvate sulfurtransferase
MAFTTLISTEVLAKHLEDPAFAIVDCRFRLDDTAWGEREYAAAHIPGAMYAHLDRDLSGMKTGTNGRHPLPDPIELSLKIGGWAITSGVQVVAYDQNNGLFASRLWWLMRWVGLTAVAVLDGGFEKWTAEKRPTRGGVEHRTRVEFRGERRPGMMVDAVTADQLTRRSDWRLVDARAPERYRGEIEPLDSQAGHIPTAVNHPYQTNVNERGTFRKPEELRKLFAPTLGPVPPDQIVCYCGSGVSACHNLLAMEHAGLKGAKLYAGSWSEWSADPSRPIETTERSAPPPRST